MIELIIQWIRDGCWEGVMQFLPQLNKVQLKYLCARIDELGLTEKVLANIPAKIWAKCAVGGE